MPPAQKSKSSRGSVANDQRVVECVSESIHEKLLLRQEESFDMFATSSISVEQGISNSTSAAAAHPPPRPSSSTSHSKKMGIPPLSPVTSASSTYRMRSFSGNSLILANINTNTLGSSSSNSKNGNNSGDKRCLVPRVDSAMAFTLRSRSRSTNEDCTNSNSCGSSCVDRARSCSILSNKENTNPSINMPITFVEVCDSGEEIPAGSTILNNSHSSKNPEQRGFPLVNFEERPASSASRTFSTTFVDTLQGSESDNSAYPEGRQRRGSSIYRGFLNIKGDDANKGPTDAEEYQRTRRRQSSVFDPLATKGTERRKTVYNSGLAEAMVNTQRHMNEAVDEERNKRRERANSTASSSPDTPAASARDSGILIGTRRASSACSRLASRTSLCGREEEGTGVELSHKQLSEAFYNKTSLQGVMASDVYLHFLEEQSKKDAAIRKERSNRRKSSSEGKARGSNASANSSSRRSSAARRPRGASCSVPSMGATMKNAFETYTFPCSESNRRLSISHSNVYVFPRSPSSPSLAYSGIVSTSARSKTAATNPEGPSARLQMLLTKSNELYMEKTAS